MTRHPGVVVSRLAFLQLPSPSVATASSNLYVMRTGSLQKSENKLRARWERKPYSLYDHTIVLAFIFALEQPS